MDRSVSRRRWLREGLPQGLLLLALLTIVYPGFFFRGEMLTGGDLLFVSRPWDQYAPPDWEGPRNRLMPDVVTAFVPYYAVSKMSLDRGEWPLWNPFELAGMPLLANAQSAVFYPPRLLHALIGDLHLAISLYVILKLWLCGMVAYASARALGLSVGGARFFSVAWMLASYNVAWAYWSLPDVSVWLPLLFVGVDAIVQARYRRGMFLTALGGAMLLLAGHPETAFAMGVGIGVYFFLRLAGERRWGRRLWQPVAAAAGGWGLAIAFGAATLLPFAEYLLNSATFFKRAAEEPELVLPFGTIASFWVPRFYGTSAEGNFWGAHQIGTSNPYMMLYSGMAVWACATLLAVKGPVRDAQRNRVLALVGAALVSTLTAFAAPGFGWINHLPVFNSMIPFYHTAFVIFAVPLLGAVGFENWFSRPRRLRELGLLLPLAILVTLTLYGLYRFHSGYIRFQGLAPYLRRELWLAAAMALASVAVLAAYVRFNRPRLLGGILALVLAADLITATRGLSPSLPREHVYPDTKLTRALQAFGHPVRIGVGEGGIASGLLAPYGIEEILGYDGLYPARIIQFQDGLKRDMWKAMMPALSIRYYLHDPRYEPEFPLKEQPGRFELVGREDDIEIYRDTQAFDRAYLVPEVRVVPEMDEMFSTMASDGFDPARTALVEAPVEGLAGAPPGTSPGTAKVIDWGFTEIVVEVDAPHPAVLVLADAYYPGWKAKIDGERADLFPVYHVLRGVVVPQGKHRVRLYLAPLSFQAGMAISIATCLASLLYAFRQRLYDPTS
jgi:hypothetical protein